jgi:hypothetical protein
MSRVSRVNNSRHCYPRVDAKVLAPCDSDSVRVLGRVNLATPYGNPGCLPVLLFSSEHDLLVGGLLERQSSKWIKSSALANAKAAKRPIYLAEALVGPTLSYDRAILLRWCLAEFGRSPVPVGLSGLFVTTDPPLRLAGLGTGVECDNRLYLHRLKMVCAVYHPPGHGSRINWLAFVSAPARPLN